MQHGLLEQMEFQIKDEVNFLVNTSFPAEIVSVQEYSSKQYVNIKPLIHLEYPDGTLDTPFIYNVPVVLPGGGGALFSVPLGVGDTVLAIISQRCIANWLLGDGSRVSDVGGDQFDINDAMAIPGLFTSNTHLSPNKDDVELKYNGMSFRLQGGGDASLENDSGGSFIMKSDGSFDFNGAVISTDGEITNAAGVVLGTHTHAQPNDSDGDVQVETLPPTQV